MINDSLSVFTPVYALEQSNISLLGIYDVTIQGISQGIQFQRSGQIRITSTITSIGTNNGVNPVDVFLVSGNPGGSPESGSIWFSTNNAFLGSLSQIDMAYVEQTQEGILIQPDSSVSAVGANVFNAYSGLTADIYQIFDGSFNLEFHNNGKSVVGTIDILGTGSIFHSNTRYQAYLTGSLSGGNGIFTNPSPSPSDLLSKLNTGFTRFQNTGVPGTYLFAGPTEAANIRRNFPGFKEEGLAFQVGVEPNDELLRFTRFQNTQRPGTYLFAGPDEAANIRQKFPNFKEEGVAFYALDSSRNLGTQIYRFQNTSVPGTYLFAGPTEKDNILANFPNFRLEGEAFEVVG